MILIQNLGKDIAKNNKIGLFLCEVCDEHSIKPLNNGYRDKSCGCARTKHGDYGSKLYWIWSEMKKRCKCKTHSRYKYYGKRGIKVCIEWEDYKPFLQWAIVSGYKEGLTIDRKDNNGNYEPSNCHFITRSENAKKGFVDNIRTWDARGKLMPLER